jgi:hypothetical protein
MCRCKFQGEIFGTYSVNFMKIFSQSSPLVLSDKSENAVCSLLARPAASFELVHAPNVLNTYPHAYIALQGHSQWASSLQQH